MIARPIQSGRFRLHARPAIEMEGGTTFYFVTGGIHEALDHARETAAGKAGVSGKPPVSA